MMYVPTVVKYGLIFIVLLVALFIGYKVIRKFITGAINEPSPTG